MKTKSLRQTFLTLCALTLVLFGNVKQADAYDFSAVCSTGQELYYNITDATNHYVEITYPGSSPDYWVGYTKPTGNITLPSSVTYVGVTYTVTAIGSYAFKNCEGLTGSLTIPSSVTTIGSQAFYYCIGFTGSLTIGNSVTTIGSDAFNNCTSFTGSLTIPNSVTMIGIRAFSGCSGFDGSLTIGNSLTEIGGASFMQCTNFTGSLTIPNSVASIGAYAFYYCTGFNGSLTIGTGVTEIDDSAFKQCTNLTAMTLLPETPPILGVEVFSNVQTDIPVYVPCESMSAYQSASGWSEFPNMQGVGCDPLIYSINPDGFSVTVTGHVDGTAATGSLTIPETKTIDGVAYTVTKIGSNAFYGCTGLTGSLTIPNPVTEILDGAFYNCTGFTGSLTIPNSVTFIGPYAFYKCSGFTGSLTIPNSVTSIGQYAFYECNGFTGSLTIPNSVIEIGGHAFKGCSGFSGTLTIGTGVTWIALSAFKNCTGFTQINYNAVNCTNLTDEYKPFEGCTNINTLTIGNTVQRIPAWIFYECSNLTGTLTLPNSVTEIGNGAFCGCTGFTGTLTIPNSVTIIDNNAFNGCTGLTGSLTIPNSVTSIGGGAFSSCNGFDGTLTIGNSVESIGIQAFMDCTGFTGSLTIPNSVTEIGYNAFIRCSGFNGSLTIGNSLASISHRAFKDCTGFTSITALPETPPTLGSEVFSLPTTIPVYVPCESMSAYQNASGWSAFTNYFDTCDVIIFADAHVKAICVQYWDTNGDSELSYDEADAVTTFNPENYGNTSKFYGTDITSFDEMQYFTGLTSTKGAFTGCANLASVTLPSHLTSIDESAFNGCSSLASIVLPDEVTSISNNVFNGCSSLASITLPSGVTSLGMRAFYGCTSLTTITLPSGINNIGNQAFYNCTGLTSLTVEAITPPDTGSQAFFLVPTTIPVYVPCQSISAYQAASQWSSFTNYIGENCNIVFADANVKTICVANWDTNNDGELSYSEAAIIESLGTVFYNNAAITSFNELQYFTGLTSIGNTAFRNCTGLTSIIIPSGVSTIGVNPFSGCSALASITVTSDNTEYDSRNNCNAIIKTASNTLITGCKNTVIPSDVTSIGMGAFERCTTLTSINLPSTLTSIGEWAFNECNSLTSVAIPSTVSSIMNNAFRNCTGLTSITVEATTPPALGDDVFKNVPTTIPVYVPCGYYAAYNNIGWGGFTNIVDPCGGVIVFADAKVKTICVANWDTNNDGELSYNEAAVIESIGTVFSGNTTITSFDELQYFTELTYIGLNAFNGCSSLESITLPSTVTAIGIEAFTGCANLTSISIPNAVTFIGRNTFKDCTSLASVTLPSGITAINEGTFNNCTSLTSVTIQSGVQSIGYEAFKGCANLTSVTLPSTVGTIGNYAFQNTGLTEIHVEATTPPTLNTTAFSNVPTTIPVYVPCGYVAEYQTATGWSRFTNFIGEGCSQESTLVDGWNWWAPTVAMTVGQLETGLGTNGLLINSQDGGFARCDGQGNWSGTLEEIEVGKMYKIETGAVCTLSLQGDRPATVTVTLESGYTWFGYTKGTEATAIATALGNFVPASGDMIIGENGTATYNGSAWTGNLTELVPGHGYVYFSTYNSTRTLTF